MKALPTLLAILGAASAQASMTLLDQCPPTYPLLSPISSSGFELVTPVVIPSGTMASGLVCSAYLSGTFGAGGTVAKLYSNAAGFPGSLLASGSSSSFVSGTGGTLLSISVSPASLLSSGTYWAGFHFVAANVGIFAVNMPTTPASLMVRQPGYSEWMSAGATPIAMRLVAETNIDRYPAKGASIWALPGTKISIPYAPAVNNVETNIAYRAVVSGSGVTSANNQMILYYNGLNHLVTRKGALAPGITTGTFSSFGDPLLNDEGKVAFAGTVFQNSTITTANDQGVWTNLGTSPLRLAWREGNSAPGISGFKFKALKWLHLGNNALYIAATASGPTVSGTSTYSGVWMFQNSTLAKVVAQKDLILLSGSNRTISSIGAPTGARTGNAQSRAAALSDTLVLQIKTSDGHTELVPYGP